MRLFDIARRDAGQACHFTDCLLAWHDPEKNGKWAPVDLWNVDAAITNDMFKGLNMARQTLSFAYNLGFSEEIAVVLRVWRGNPA